MPSVLVVNDALDEREMYARTLRASGYQAIEAATFTAAYQIATTNRLDIVVTDVRIAGSISGLELTRRLRSDPRTSTVSIIVLTNVSRPQDGDVALKAGADTFLEKPVRDPLLMAEILRLLAGSRRLLPDAALQAGDIATSFHQSARCPHVGLKEGSQELVENRWASTLSADRVRPCTRSQRSP